MTRGFLRSIVGSLFLVVLLTVTALNVWQSERIERRQVDLLQRLDALEKAVADGAAAPTRTAVATPGDAMPAYVLEAMQDPRNLLRLDPEPWLPPGATGGGTLHSLLGDDPKGFNFVAENGSDVQEINSYVNEMLINRHHGDTTLRAPGLAYSMVEEDEGKTYVFKLRKDFRWHEPAVDWSTGRYEWLRGEHPVTAHDVAFWFEMVQNADVTGAASKRSYFENLLSFEATDDYTLTLRFSKKTFAQFLIMLDVHAVPRFLYQFDEDGHPYDKAILGQKFQDHWYNPRALGCGAYRFVSWEPGVALILEKDRGYPGSGNAHDRIVYSVLKDQGQWPRKLRTKELHISVLQPGQYRQEVLEGTPDSPFKDGTLLSGDHMEYGFFYIAWNQQRPMFSDRRVRWAMSHAFNAEMLLQKVFLGMGERATGPIASFSPFYDRSIPPIPFDLQRAAALLDEAGWTDSDGDGIRDKVVDGQKLAFRFTLMLFGSSNEYSTLGSIFKEDLAKIGVTMELLPMDWANYLKKAEDREFDAMTAAWATSPDVDFNQIWHSTQADLPKSSNRIGFKNAEADSIIDAMTSEFDVQRRIELCHRFHKLIYDEQPYTFFYTRKRPVFWQKELQHVVFQKDRPHRNPRAWFLSTPTAP